MPVDDRKILTGIRMPGTKEGKRFTHGDVITDPDELVASGADLQALYDQGAISGTWKGVKAASPETEEAPAKSKAKK